MRRVTAPGGPHVSHVKKRRVAELKNAYGNDGPQPSSQSQQQQQQSQQVERSSSGAPSSSGQAAAGPAAVKFPYTPLDPGLRDSQLFSYFKNVDTEAAEAANEATAATSHLPKWVLAKNATPVSRGYVEVFVEGLLATNKGQSADSLAAAAMKLVDRTIQLDNPVKAGSAASQAGLRQGRVGYCTRLVRRVKGGGSVVSHLKHLHKRHKSAVSYAQLQQLHEMWKAYIAGILPEQPSAGKANNGNNNGAGSSGANAASNAGGGAAVSEDRLLASAELRGCLVKVLRARDTRHVGVQGIVAALTKNVVCVVDASDNLHVVPLKGCMVQYDAPGNRIVTLNLSSDRR